MDDPTNPLGYVFSKEQLTRGWSYPLKRSVLDRALLEAGVTGVTHVTYILDTRPLSDPRRPPLSVTYLGYDRRCMIEVRTVPSASRRAVADDLEQLLGEVAGWMAEIDDRPPTWRSEWHALHAVVTDDGLRLATAP